MRQGHQMATELAKIDRISRDRPLATLSLPAWLQRSVNGLTVGSIEATREDGIAARLPVPTIVRSLSPSPAMRAAIENRIFDLDRALAAIDLDVAMTRVTEMLFGFTVQALGEKGVAARARSYMVALDDLPAWATAEACRRWLRAEAGEHNYSFPPTPPVLREIAERCALPVQRQVDQLRRLLDAKEIPDPVEFSEEHKAGMRQALKALMHGIVEKEGRQLAAQADALAAREEERS
jgi:hypothetical protein